MEIINQSRFNELKATGQLPSPKGVAVAILDLLQKADVTVQDITRITQTDPALSGRLIKFANSAHLGSHRPVASVGEAVMMIGLPMVRQLVLGFSVLSDFRNGRCQAFDYDGFWSSSLATAIANQALSTRAKTSAEETFTCGLMSKIGSLALATLYPDKYARVLTESAGKPLEDLIRLEQEYFATDHNELTVALMKDWGFPVIFMDTVYHHENPDLGDFSEGSRAYTLAHALHLASKLAKICLAEQNERRLLLPQLYVLGARLGIDSEALMALSDRVASEWQDWGRILDVPTLEVPPFAEIAASMPTAPEVAEGEKTETATQDEFPLRILVVDKDESILASLQKILSKPGYSVLTATNGRDGMHRAIEHNPQIIISDWLMPEMDGIDFCKSLRTTKEGRAIYFLILTALEQEEKLVEAFEAGVDDYIVKPFSPKILMARLRAGQRVLQMQDEISREREELRRVASELAITNRRLQRLALTDTLTLLPNRRYGIDSLEQEWASAKKKGRSLTCMLIDLDRFKLINDTYGHDAGDSALKQAAAVLKDTTRVQDIVSRIGGEEFLVICPDTPIKAAEQDAEYIRKAFESSAFKVGSINQQITVSIGVAEFHSGMPDFSALLKAADEAMYQAKHQGMNRVVLAATPNS